jgi:hypothetical protein
MEKHIRNTKLNELLPSISDEYIDKIINEIEFKEDEIPTQYIDLLTSKKSNKGIKLGSYSSKSKNKHK